MKYYTVKISFRIPSIDNENELYYRTRSFLKVITEMVYLIFNVHLVDFSIEE